MRRIPFRRVSIGCASVALFASTVVLLGGSGWATTSRAADVSHAVSNAQLKGFDPPPPATVTSSSAGASGPGYTSTIDQWSVNTGPGDSTPCSIAGELFVPASASASSPDPAILTTNGFGGSYADQVSLAEFFVQKGFVVLTYSGLGFGGSGCDIELDSPKWDGEAASQLVSFLGEQSEVLTDGPDDAVVGMVGGSYGGEIQFATASIDPRIRAIVPIITWNDLAYSLAPNNATSASNPDWLQVAPGVLKWEWTTLFFADGMSEPFQNPTDTPFPPSTCPGFDSSVCTAYIESASAGYPTPDVVSMLESDSVVSYYRKIRIPVMLMQGEDDSLFNIDEAVANYRLFKSEGDPVKLVIQSWGHSDSTPAPGEVSYTSTAQGYETLLILDWFDKYLKSQKVSTGPAVEYFRPWVKYDTSSSAEPAYGTSASWPVGTTEDLYLSADQALVANPGSVTGGSQTFVNPPDGQPGSYSETSGVQDESPISSIPPTDPAGTYASFETPPLAKAVDSVGIPQLTFDLQATDASSVNPLAEATIYAKIYDVSPSGSLTLVNRIVSPSRFESTGKVTVTLPAVVHKYSAGDRIELVIAATDQAYFGARLPDTLSVSFGGGDPGILRLPIVAASDQASGGRRATGS
jgi:putative CocE/NonD family hydrolase